MLALRAVLGTALVALACAVALAAAADDPPVHGDPADAIREYHDSGEWARDQRDVLGRARRYVTRRLGELRGARRRPAIVLDVDDTSLSNYSALEPYDFDRARANVGSAYLRADAPAIRPTRSLYRLAQRRGVRVFFVTGRSEEIREPTALNLERAGYRGRHELHMRPAGDSGSAVPYKSGVRRRIQRRGFRILANVGDQYSDLEGGAAERRFKVPNPMYFLP